MSSYHLSPTAIHQLTWVLGGLLVASLLLTAWAIGTFRRRLLEGKAELEKLRQDARLMQLDQLPNQE